MTFGSNHKVKAFAPPKLNKYMRLVDYLIDDRELKIVWDGDGENLFCPEKIRSEMEFLVG